MHLKVSIEESLEEKLQRDCSACGKEKPATKTNVFTRLPPVLIIAISRFGKDERGRLVKKRGLVNYPMMMQLSAARGEGQVEMMYQLRGVACHSGVLKTGHYTCICKHLENER